MTPGQIAYEAYCQHTGWKSLATGADLPKWEKLNIEIQEAWTVAAEAVQLSMVGASVMGRYDSKLLGGRVDAVKPQIEVTLYAHS